ncbi:MAG: DUF4349 domain-containing protein [Bacteroidota bacterium]
MRLFYPFLALFVIAALSLGVGCTRGGSESASPSYEERRTAMDVGEAIPVSETGAPTPTPRVDRQLIKTGRLTLRVHSYDEAVTALRDTIARYDAYLSGEQEQRRTYRIENTLTIRVATDEFDTLVDALSQIGGSVEARAIDVDDVTEEYVDIQARLRSRRAAEERYLDILQRATTVEDILTVQRQLDQVREEIERVEGQLRFLRDRVGFSTLTVSLYQETEFALTEGPGFFARVAESFEAGWRSILELTLGLIALWPLLLLLVAGAWTVRRWRRKHPSSKQSTPPRTVPPA